MDEVTKYTKLWDLPQGYGNNWDHPYWLEIALFIRRAMDDRGFQVGMSVLDVGGGKGDLRKVIFKGCEYQSLDIAPNSGADIIVDITEWDCMTDWGESECHFYSYDWVIAVDVLEHIPTERVSFALENISVVSFGGAIFLISIRPDRGGKKIGATLHMTVRPTNWWLGQINKHWETVELLREVPGEYCIVVCQ